MIWGQSIMGREILVLVWEVSGSVSLDLQSTCWSRPYFCNHLMSLTVCLLWLDPVSCPIFFADYIWMFQLFLLSFGDFVTILMCCLLNYLPNLPRVVFSQGNVFLLLNVPCIFSTYLIQDNCCFLLDVKIDFIYLSSD